MYSGIIYNPLYTYGVTLETWNFIENTCRARLLISVEITEISVKFIFTKISVKSINPKMTRKSLFSDQNLGIFLFFTEIL